MRVRYWVDTVVARRRRVEMNRYDQQRYNPVMIRAEATVGGVPTRCM